jgi:hypothetical protein
MIVLLVDRWVAVLGFLTSKKSTDFVFTQRSACKLHFDDANLIKFVESVVVVFGKADLKILSNQIQVDCFQLSRLVVTSCVVV